MLILSSLKFVFFFFNFILLSYQIDFLWSIDFQTSVFHFWHLRYLLQWVGGKELAAGNLIMFPWSLNTYSSHWRLLMIFFHNFHHLCTFTEFIMTERYVSIHLLFYQFEFKLFCSTKLQFNMGTLIFCDDSILADFL